VELAEATGPVSFAATGKSERTIAAYSSAGSLSYWDLGNGGRLANIAVPAALKEIVFFANNRYFLGIGETSMRIVDALTGAETASRSIEGKILAFTKPESPAEVGFLNMKGNFIAYGSVDGSKEKPVLSPWEKYLLFDEDRFTSVLDAVHAEKKMLLAFASGEIGYFDQSDTYPDIKVFQTGARRPINDFILDDRTLLAVSEGTLLLIPADPYALGEADTITQKRVDHAQRLARAGKNALAFWREAEPALDIMNAQTTIRVPLESFQDYLLVLDSVSGLRIINTADMETLHAYSSVGLIDAEFLDDSRVVLGKSAAVAPFVTLLVINFKTGETVARDIGGTAAVRVHRGDKTGAGYAFLVESGTTRLVRFDPASPETPTALIEYASEDVQPFIAEGPDYLAAALGGDGSVIYSAAGVMPLERTSGLPRKLLAAQGVVTVLDSDGALAWHDAHSGKSIASLRLVGNRWIMKRDGRSLTGPIGEIE
jgi:hypothetical protein